MRKRRVESQAEQRFEVTCLRKQQQRFVTPEACLGRSFSSSRWRFCCSLLPWVLLLPYMPRHKGLPPADSALPSSCTKGPDLELPGSPSCPQAGVAVVCWSHASSLSSLRISQPLWVARGPASRIWYSFFRSPLGPELASETTFTSATLWRAPAGFYPRAPCCSPGVATMVGHSAPSLRPRPPNPLFSTRPDHFTRDASLRCRVSPHSPEVMSTCFLMGCPWSLVSEPTHCLVSWNFVWWATPAFPGGWLMTKAWYAVQNVPEAAQHEILKLIPEVRGRHGVLAVDKHIVMVTS